MKTSELRKVVEENEYKFQKTENRIHISYLGIERMILDLRDQSITLGDDVKLGSQRIKKIMVALIEYSLTPLNEREDEKKYKIELNEICEGVLSKEEMRTMVYSMSSRIQSTLHQKLIFKEVFTQSEVDNFPAEIKGAIECGFLRKVEVE